MNTKEMNMISGLKVSLIKICRSSDNLRGSRTVMDAFAGNAYCRSRAC